MKNWKLIDPKFPSSLQGYVLDGITYSDLVETFGKPNSDSDGYKTDAEWCIEFENGIYATIYNYKTGKNYDGENGLDVEDITDWHIGGNNKEVVDLVNQTIIDSKTN